MPRVDLPSIRCCLAVLGVVVAAAPALAAPPTSGSSAVDFVRDVRPILSDNCFFCHGPDPKHREGELRLDQREGLFRVKDGVSPVVPGKPQESDLLARVLSEDKAEVMPPRKTGKELTPAQVETLRRWIEAGAPWQEHWAFAPLRKPTPPQPRRADWPVNDIDRFVLHVLELRGLSPSPEADAVTLLRRVSLDLTGLAPTPAEVDRYIADPRPDRYERAVDRLLASPQYGERMAVHWLDLVRYADTVGYHGDQEHHASPYRDYVIKAFNDNLPYDRFTAEQLAGDLMPSPTLWQMAATAYNRILQTSHEGGVQPAEYLAKYAADRVRNLGSVWMGLTTGCAECHDHKFDPFTARDFYSLAAFFADVKEKGDFKGAPNTTPTRRDPEMRVWDLPAYEAVRPIDEKIAALTPRMAKADVLAAQAALAASTAPATAPQRRAEPSPAPGKGKAKSKGATKDADTNKPKEPDAAQGKPSPKPSPMPAAELTGRAAELLSLLRQRQELERTMFQTCMVTQSAPPREVRVLPRGNWMDSSGELVQPATPSLFKPLKTAARATRLDLARWLTSADNPMASRAMVNRVWAIFFGRGLSRQLDDLGNQGETPLHAELMEHLAWGFQADHDVKKLVRAVVTSRTYRQSSLADARQRLADPENQWLARQSRWRLPAEFVRDQALAVSGLLNGSIGGPSVKPYQPALYYRHLNFPQREYQPHLDERQHRRGLYVHWQRQYLHPMLRAFDAPTREECAAERPRSNTPLASLTLLNDPTFVEAAQAFAGRILREAPAGDAARIAWAWRAAVSRAPSSEASRALLDLLAAERAALRADPATATAAQTPAGLWKPDPAWPAHELGAWTSVARAILNLHETYARD